MTDSLSINLECIIINILLFILLLFYSGMKAVHTKEYVGVFFHLCN